MINNESSNGWRFTHEQCTQRVEGSGVISITRRSNKQVAMGYAFGVSESAGMDWVDVPIENARGGGVGLRVTYLGSVHGLGMLFMCLLLIVPVAYCLNITRMSIMSIAYGLGNERQCGLSHWLEGVPISQMLFNHLFSMALW